jgi:DNA-binding transcriptional ArsR family regulator
VGIDTGLRAVHTRPVVSMRRHVRICWLDAEADPPLERRYRHRCQVSLAITRDGIAREAGVPVKLVREHARTGLLQEQSPYQVVAYIARRQRQELLRRVSWRVLSSPIPDQDFVEVLGLVAIVLPHAWVALARELPERLGPETVERWSRGRTLPSNPMKARVVRAVAKLVRADKSTDVLVEALDRMDGRHARADGHTIADRIVEQLSAGPAVYRDIARAIGALPKVVSNALGVLRQHGIAETDGGVWRLVVARDEVEETAAAE